MPGGRRGTETELNSHGHLVFKPPNEANPKPNSFSPQAQQFFGPGGALLGGMELVVEAEVNGEASEPTLGQLLTALYQSVPGLSCSLHSTTNTGNDLLSYSCPKRGSRAGRLCQPT